MAAIEYFQFGWQISVWNVWQWWAEARGRHNSSASIRCAISKASRVYPVSSGVPFIECLFTSSALLSSALHDYAAYPWLIWVSFPFVLEKGKQFRCYCFESNMFFIIEFILFHFISLHVILKYYLFRVVFSGAFLLFLVFLFNVF